MSPQVSDSATEERVVVYCLRRGVTKWTGSRIDSLGAESVLILLYLLTVVDTKMYVNPPSATSQDCLQPGPSMPLHSESEDLTVDAPSATSTDSLQPGPSMSQVLHSESE